jgi:hypothetical protein
MVDDLAFQFPKAPSDISANQVIIGYWDGVEWRKPPIISIKGIVDEVDQSNIDNNRVGPLSGLKTIVYSGNYITAPGVIIDREGLKQTLEENFTVPVRVDDTYFDRVDRIIYRRPNDDENRIGMRMFVLGGAYDSVITKIAFEPIKQALKRDLDKYESIRKRNSDNGSKGGRPTKPKETQTTQPFHKKPKKADSDSGSDIVIDSVKQEYKLAFDLWVQYKKEKKQKYTPTGIAQLIKSVETKYTPFPGINFSLASGSRFAVG